MYFFTHAALVVRKSLLLKVRLAIPSCVKASRISFGCESIRLLPFLSAVSFLLWIFWILSFSMVLEAVSLWAFLFSDFLSFPPLSLSWFFLRPRLLSTSTTLLPSTSLRRTPLRNHFACQRSHAARWTCFLSSLVCFFFLVFFTTRLAELFLAFELEDLAEALGLQTFPLAGFLSVVSGIGFSSETMLALGLSSAFSACFSSMVTVSKGWVVPGFRFSSKTVLAAFFCFSCVLTVSKGWTGTCFRFSSKTVLASFFCFSCLLTVSKGWVVSGFRFSSKTVLASFFSFSCVLTVSKGWVVPGFRFSSKTVLAAFFCLSCVLTVSKGWTGTCFSSKTLLAPGLSCSVTIWFSLSLVLSASLWPPSMLSFSGLAMVSLELAGVSSPRPGKIKVDAIEELDAGESGKARARFGVTWSSRLGAALLLVAAGTITKFCKRRSR